MKALLQKALDAIEATCPKRSSYISAEAQKEAWTKHEGAIKALRAFIAQGESEPKKWLSWSAKCGEQAWDTQDEAELNSDEDFEPVPLYTRGMK